MELETLFRLQVFVTLATEKSMNPDRQAGGFEEERSQGTPRAVGLPPEHPLLEAPCRDSA